MRDAIANAIRDALGGDHFIVERPRELAHGDYSTNAALVNKIDAHELAAKLRIDGVERVEVVGKFINFYLTREALVPKPVQLPQPYAGKEVLVEYTSPNLFKPLHIGNLIGNILGESVARLLAASGAAVRRLNYPSDIGLTVAKGVWGLQKNSLDPTDIAQLGKAYVAGNAAYEDGSAKEEIDAINVALYENSNSAWSDLRKRGIETSRRHLDELCARLGTAFDKEFFESESGPLGAELVRKHVGSVFEESEGATIYRSTHVRVFLNSKGLPTYEAKEIGLFKLKSDAYPNYDASYTVTGGEQKDFFAVVFDAVKKVFPDRTAGKTLGHIANGFLKLTTGKMSSRLGNVITGESLINDLIAAAKEKMQGRDLKDADKTAEMIAVGAIKYAVLKQGSGKDIVFDPEKSLSLEGDSGPYLQYAHTRALSLVRAAQEAGVAPLEWPDGGRSGPLGQDLPSASPLERALVHYPAVVERAAREMEPHYLTTYLTELAGAFNSWYAQGKVIGGPHPHFGVLLTSVFERTMREGLTLLGIPVPEEM